VGFLFLNVSKAYF